MGYAENVAGGQLREQVRLTEKQIAVQLETNKLLRLLLKVQGVETVEPEVGSPAGDFAPQTRAQKFGKIF